MTFPCIKRNISRNHRQKRKRIEYLDDNKDDGEINSAQRILTSTIVLPLHIQDIDFCVMEMEKDMNLLLNVFVNGPRSTKHDKPMVHVNVKLTSYISSGGSKGRGWCPDGRLKP